MRTLCEGPQGPARGFRMALASRGLVCVSRERIGAVEGAILAFVTIFGSMFLISIGKSLEGLAVIVAEAAALAIAVRKAKIASAEELQKKGEQSDSNTIQPHQPE